MVRSCQGGTPAEETESQGDVDRADDRGLGAFNPLLLRTAADEVVAVLANAIGGGLYGVGDLLPRERDLAERLGVSRTVVREALAVLRRAGVVTVRRGVAGGATVASPAALPQVLSNLHGPSTSTLQSLLEARRPLELAAMTLAGARASDAELVEIRRELIDPLPDLIGEPEEFLALDVRFHMTMPKLARSPVVEELLAAVISRLVATLTQFPFGRVADLHRAIKNQIDTMDALETRDPDQIRVAVESHLATLEEQFLGHPLAAA
jgi:GntR family transcriptional regulator, transcriptional repressor for pyruvate dehydrogenase complex